MPIRHHLIEQIISLKEEGSFRRLRGKKKGQEKMEDPLPGPSFLLLLTDKE